MVEEREYWAVIVEMNRRIYIKKVKYNWGTGFAQRRRFESGGAREEWRVFRRR
jgi:hypothetical protein